MQAFRVKPVFRDDMPKYPRAIELALVLESSESGASKMRSCRVETLARTIETTKPTRIALIGPGRSGKSMLAAALGHRLRIAFGGRIDWFRSAAWGFYTLSAMLALRFGTGRGDGRARRLQQFLAGKPWQRAGMKSPAAGASARRTAKPSAPL